VSGNERSIALSGAPEYTESVDALDHRRLNEEAMFGRAPYLELEIGL
jgi:hypothetical protein